MPSLESKLMRAVTYIGHSKDVCWFQWMGMLSICVSWHVVHQRGLIILWKNETETPQMFYQCDCKGIVVYTSILSIDYCPLVITACHIWTEIQVRPAESKKGLLEEHGFAELKRKKKEPGPFQGRQGLNSTALCVAQTLSAFHLASL